MTPYPTRPETRWNWADLLLGPSMAQDIGRVTDEGEDRLQAVLAAGLAEARQLQATILALREQLEGVAAARDEARQLQDTLQALRAEVDQLRFEHAAALERQRQAAQAELRQLRETLTLVRAEAERVRAG